MKSNILKALIVAVGVAGTAAPPSYAANTATAPVQVATVKPLDVALGQGKVLHGQVVNAQNAPQAGVAVSLLSRGEVVSQATTDGAGAFQMPVKQGGTYVVSAEGSQQVVRTWTEDSAPPAAREGVLMVTDPTAVRGQAGAWLHENWVCLGLITGFGTYLIVEASAGGEKPSGS